MEINSYNKNLEEDLKDLSLQILKELKDKGRLNYLINYTHSTDFNGTVEEWNYIKMEVDLLIMVKMLGICPQKILGHRHSWPYPKAEWMKAYKEGKFIVFQPCPKKKEKRIQVQSRQRFRILERNNFTCQGCGRKPPDVELRVDHIDPAKTIGQVSDEDLITLCEECNSGKNRWRSKIFELHLKDINGNNR